MWTLVSTRPGDIKGFEWVKRMMTIVLKKIIHATTWMMERAGGKKTFKKIIVISPSGRL